MTVREIPRISDPRLLRVAQPVTEFDSDSIHLLVSDMFDTMRAANGAGSARRGARMRAWCSTNATT